VNEEEKGKNLQMGKRLEKKAKDGPRKKPEREC